MYSEFQYRCYNEHIRNVVKTIHFIIPDKQVSTLVGSVKNYKRIFNEVVMDSYIQGDRVSIHTIIQIRSIDLNYFIHKKNISIFSN